MEYSKAIRLSQHHILDTSALAPSYQHQVIFSNEIACGLYFNSFFYFATSPNWRR